MTHPHYDAAVGCMKACITGCMKGCITGPGARAHPEVSSVGMMDWRPLETSQVEKRSPMRVNSAMPCVRCPVRTCMRMD